MIKIKVSYTEEQEAENIMQLLHPIKSRFKIKKSEGTPPYKHLFFNPRKPGTPEE